MNVRIEIDTKTFVRFWLVVIGFGLVALAIYSARTALIIIGTAFFLAIALSPSVNRLARILPSKSRVLSTALSYIAVVIALSVVFFLAVPPIVSQTNKFAQNIPSLVETATRQYSGVDEIIDKYELQPQVDKIVTSLKDGTTNIASNLVVGIGSLLSTITAGILVLVLTFLMLVEGPIWLNRLWILYKDQELKEYHRKLISKMYSVVTSYVTGQLMVSAIAGFVAGIAVFCLSVIFDITTTSLAIPVATIVFISSLIPLFGGIIGSLLVCVILALNNISASVIFLIFAILYQQLESNYISPKIQSKRIDISALVILLSVTIGIYLFGIAGGIISIPIAGCVKIFAEDYFSRIHKVETENKGPINRFIRKIKENI